MQHTVTIHELPATIRRPARMQVKSFGKQMIVDYPVERVRDHFHYAIREFMLGYPNLFSAHHVINSRIVREPGRTKPGGIVFTVTSD